MALQIIEGDVNAVTYVAENADVASIEHLAQSRNDSLDSRVVWGHAITNEAVWRRQVLKEVNRYVEIAFGFEHDVGRINACRTSADNGETKFCH